MPYQNTNTSRYAGGTGGNGSNVPPRPTTPRGLAEENALIAKLGALNELEAETLVSIAEKAGKLFYEQGVSSTQIRRIHEHIIRQLAKSQTHRESVKEIFLLKYHLAYAVGRDRQGKNLKSLADFFNPILDKVYEMKDLERFRQLFDAVLAYHKFFESN